MKKVRLIGEWQMNELLKRYDEVADLLPKNIAIGYALAKEYIEPSHASVLQFEFVLANRAQLEINLQEEVADDSCNVQS